MKAYAWIIKFGMLCAGVIILFQVISLLVIYRYLKMDYYACVVALFFLAAGLLIKRKQPNLKTGTEAVNNPIHLLTTRETEVFSMLIAGKSNKEIAAAHYVELSTVKSHINNIYAKLALSSRREAIARYAK